MILSYSKIKVLLNKFTSPAPIEMIACEAYGCVSTIPTTDQVSEWFIYVEH